MFSKLHWAVGIATLLLLAACRPAEEALAPVELQPTPSILTLSYPPTLRWLQPAFNACALEDPLLTVLTVEAETNPDVILYWSEPDETVGEVILLGEDHMLLVANPASSVISLNHAEVRQLFSDNARTWPNGDPLTIYSLPGGHAVQNAFESALGSPVPRSVDIQIAPSLEAMQQYVADDPTALGILPQSWLNASIKAMHWDDAPPEIRQPILAGFTDSYSEDFVRCIQNAVAEKLAETSP